MNHCGGRRGERRIVKKSWMHCQQRWWHQRNILGCCKLISRRDAERRRGKKYISLSRATKTKKQKRKEVWKLTWSHLQWLKSSLLSRKQSPFQESTIAKRIAFVPCWKRNLTVCKSRVHECRIRPNIWGSVIILKPEKNEHGLWLIPEKGLSISAQSDIFLSGHSIGREKEYISHHGLLFFSPLSHRLERNTLGWSEKESLTGKDKVETKRK